MPDTAYLEKGRDQRRYRPQIGEPIDVRKLDPTQFQAVEWNIVACGGVLVERTERIRQYERDLSNTKLVSLVYDGNIDASTAQRISGIAKNFTNCARGYSHGNLWVWYHQEGKGVNGFNPCEETGFQRVKKPQVAFEIDKDGDLEKRTIKEIKEALLKAVQNQQ